MLRRLPILVVAALAAGCGAAQESDERPFESLRPAATAPDEPSLTHSVSGSYLFFESGGESQRPAEVYAILRRPRTQDDERAAVGASGWFAFDPADPTGRPLVDETRAALQDVRGDTLFVTPTDRDRVCFGLLPDGGGSCGGVTANGLEIAWFEEGSSLVVYGLVGDGIVGVDVVIAGGTHPARMGENAYALEVHRARHGELHALVLRSADGSTESVPLTW